MNKREQLASLTDRELNRAVYLSQLLFLLTGFFLAFFYFEDLGSILRMCSFHMRDLLFYGVLMALAFVLVELVLYYLLPHHFFDDGGVNERIFKHRSVASIIGLCILVSVSEEFLFRGVLQTAFGLVIASMVFALLHTRYIRKPVLFMMIVVTSFWIGYLFELTNNLLVTILFHFVVNVSLGLWIKYR